MFAMEREGWMERNREQSQASDDIRNLFSSPKSLWLRQETPEVLRRIVCTISNPFRSAVLAKIHGKTLRFEGHHKKHLQLLRQ